ncbi:hypothetical protein NEIELOOT_00363 [Neisseria elongata subsp. glycolytica ATCC 29315]|uniref:Uncharacterized protein n=1 Tax=Neisseria elongata subsp. glycolytica ATCC 29315 TaxID=546263 RepID=D4DMT9_NEIEG|nr:hypothetical protein NEIELOOT_00363 [Neisseria elongata subsp. glycolytica ATCC 29315]
MSYYFRVFAPVGLNCLFTFVKQCSQAINGKRRFFAEKSEKYNSERIGRLKRG